MIEVGATIAAAMTAISIAGTIGIGIGIGIGISIAGATMPL